MSVLGNYVNIIKTIESLHKPESSIEQIIQEAFVPSLWGNTLVERKTLHGRVSFWVHSIFSKIDVEKTYALVKQAFIHLEDNNYIINKRETLLHRKLYLFSYPASFEAPLPIENPENVEIYRKSWIEQSFIAEPRQKKTAISTQGVHQWLSSSPSSAPEIWDLLKEFFPSTGEMPKLILSGIEQMTSFKKQFLQNSHTLDVIDNLDSIAGQTLEKISQLRPGEKWLLCGTFGSNPLSNLGTLPEFIKKQIPEETFNILETLTPQAPEKFITTHLKNKLNKMAEGSPTFAKFLDDPRTNFIFTNKSREIPEHYYNILPPIYTDALNTVSRNGVLYYIFLLLPEGSIKEFLQWVNKNSQNFAKFSNQETLNQMEGPFANLIQPAVRVGFDAAGEIAQSLTKILTCILPPQMVEVLGMDAYLFSGNVWVEFERNTENTYHVKIYGTEQALMYHETDHKGNVIWPLVYENVPADSLTMEFMSDLLSYSLEPLVNGEKISTPKLLYKDVLSRLPSPMRDPASDKTIPSGQQLENFWDYTFAILQEKNWKPESKYQITKELLLGYIESLRDKSDQLILSPEAFGTIGRLLSRMHSEASRIAHLLPMGESQKIQATRNWLQFEIKQYEIDHPKDNEKYLLPKQILIELKKLLKKFHITPNNFHESKELVVKAFGEGFSHLFDVLGEDLKKPLGETKNADEEYQGWFLEQLQNLYSYTAYKLYRLALGLVDTHTPEISTISYTQAIHTLLVNTLPGPIKEAYCNALEYLVSTLKRLALNFACWLFTQGCDEKTLNDLKNVHNDLKAVAQSAVSAIDPTSKLSFKIEGELPAANLQWKGNLDGGFNINCPTRDNSAYSFYTHFSVHFPFPSNPKSLDIKCHLEKIIYQLKEIKDVNERALNAIYIIHTFPIPSNLEKTVWDQASLKEAVLECVAEIAYIASQFTREEFIHTSLAQYIALAVMDKLARHCDPLLDGFTVYAVDLLDYYDRNYYFSSPKHLEVVDQLCAYFMPDVKLKKVPKYISKHKELFAYTQKALFLTAKGLGTWEVSETAYYRKLIGGRPFASLFPENGPTMGYPRRYHPKTEAEAIVLLEQESQILNERNSPIPRAFALLKRQTWAAHYYGRGLRTSFHDYQQPRSEFFNIPERQKLKKSLIYCNPVHDDAKFLGIEIGYDYPKYFKSEIDYRYPNYAEIPQPRNKTTQSRLTASLGYSPQKKDIDYYDRQTVNKVHDQKKDAFIRHLEYFEHLQKSQAFDLNSHNNNELPFFIYALKDASYEVIDKGLAIIHKNIESLSQQQSSAALWWIYQAIKLQEFAVLFPFAQQLNFLNYREMLYALLKSDPRKFESAWCLITLTFPQNPQEATQEEQEKCAFAIAMTQFFPPFSNKEVFHFRKSYWKSVLDEYLKRPHFANALGNKLLSYFTPIKDAQQTFTLEGLTLKNAIYSFDIAVGKFNIIKKEAFTKDTFLSTIKQWNEGKDFYEAVSDFYVSNDHECAYFFGPLTQAIYEYRSFKDAPTSEWYKKCANATLPPGISAFAGFPDESFWLESGEKTIKHIYNKRISLVVDTSAQNRILKIIYEGQTLVPIEFSAVKAQLRPIERFATSPIQCWADENTHLLKYITFDKYLITIETEDGISRATLIQNGTKYFIDDTYFPILNRIPRHLVLEDINGNKSALVRANQWLPSIAARMVEPLQLRDEATYILFDTAIAVQDQIKEFPAENYQYTITEDGQMTSSDPNALAYLLSLFSLQGKTKEAEKIANEILLLSRQIPLPYSMLDTLRPLLFVPDNSNKASLALKMVTAFAQNKFTHIPEKIDSDPTWITLLFFVASALKDTLLNGKSLKELGLNDKQEWYVYKFISHIIVSLLQENDDLKALLSFFPPDSILQLLDFSPELSKRIEELNKKFKVTDSIFIKGAKCISTIQSFMPSDQNPLLRLAAALPQESSSNTPFDFDLLKIFWNGFISKSAESFHLDKTGLPKLWEKLSPAERSNFDLTLKDFRQNLIPHFADFYAIARNQTEQLPALRQILKRYKNSWSNESRLLVLVLSAVCENPKKFLPLKDLRNCLVKDELALCTDKKERSILHQKLYEPFEELFKAVFKQQYVAAGWSTFTSVALAVGLQKFTQKDEPSLGESIHAITSFVPHSGKIITAINTGKAVYDYIKAEKATQAPETAIVCENHSFAPNLDLLNAFDSQLQNILRIIYDHAFTEKPFKDSNETYFQPFSVDPEASEKDKAQLDIPNKSYVDYRNRKERVPNHDKIKGIDELWKGFKWFIALKDDVESQYKTLRAEIKTLLNPKKLAHLPTISLKEMRRAIMHTDFKMIDAKVGIETRQRLIEKMFLCDAIQSRLNQLEKIYSYFNGALDALDAENGMEFGKQTQALGVELKVIRRYNFKNIPFRLSYRLLTYERVNKQMLWESQVRAFSKQLLTDEKHMLSELMPSLGKTALGLGLQKSYLADGKHVPVTSVPKQLADTNFKFVSKQCQTLYDMEDTILEINSGQRRTAENYQALYAHFVNALENKESLSMIKESSQALELEFFTLCRQMYSTKSIFNPQLELGSAIEALKNILIFNKQHCILLGDEWHYQARQNKELIKPVGRKLNLEPAIVNTIVKALNHLVYFPNLHEKIQANELYRIDEKTYKEIAIHTAGEISCDPRYGIEDGQKAEFIQYLTDKFSPLPDFIEKHPLWKEISTIRGLLSVVIENVMKQDINVGYGIVTENHIEKAREEDGMPPIKISLNACPFEGNNAPLIGYSLQSPYEDFVKSYFSYLFNGLVPTACDDLLSTLFSHGEKEADTLKKPFDQTIAYQLFEKIETGTQLKDPKEYSVEEKEKIYQAFKHNRIAVYLYVKHFVSKDIFFWERYARSNSTNYVDMYSSSKVQTGTPYNTGVYFPGTKIFYDEGTIGEILHLISNKCPPGGISVIPNQTPFEALETILKNYFSSEMNFSMIVDGAPFFKGITNIDVANRMAAFCNENKLPKEAIVFFHKDKLVFMNIRTRELRPFSECKLRPDQYLTYLDDPHGFGANVPQSGSAINTAGDQPFHKMLQESFRLRELKKIITLLLKGDLKEFCAEFSKIAVQEIHFVMMQETCDKIHPKTANAPKVEELFKHNFDIENEQNKPANYEAYLQHLHNVVRRAIIEKALATANLNTLLDIIKTYEDFLIPPTQMDPTKLFGWTLKDEETSKAIELTKESLLNVIRNTKYFIKNKAKDEVASIRKLMDEIPVPPVPKTVRIAVKGDKVDTSVNGQLNKDVCVSQETAVDVENTQETQLETQTQLQTQEETAVANYGSWSLEYQEVKWEMSYSPRSLDWKSVTANGFVKAKIKQGITHIQSKSLDFVLGKNKVKSTKQVHYTTSILYSFAEVCAKSESSTINEIAGVFDKRLWVTENFLPLKKMFDTKPFEFRHSNVYKILLHIEEREGVPYVVSAGCLTRKESRRWEKFLKAPKTEKDPYKVVIYDLYQQGKEAGDDVDMKLLQQTKDFKDLISQIHYFNGDVNYSNELLQDMKNWVRKHNVNKLANAMSMIALRFPRYKFKGSDIDILFSSMQKIALEELL